MMSHERGEQLKDTSDGFSSFVRLSWNGFLGRCWQDVLAGAEKKK